MSTSQVLTSFKELSAIVTGGSSGLGLATVERLSKLGCIVAIIDINEPKKLPLNAYFIKADVTSEQEVKKALEIIESKAKKLDILVNCAGMTIPGPIFDIETKTPFNLNDFEKVLRINTTGTINMIRLCCSLFDRNQPNSNQQKGVIINTASVTGYEGPASYIAYSTSKSAIVGMTLPLARDLAPMGVRVMAIAPGGFLTPMVEAFGESMVVTMGNEAQFPKRLGHPDEFAHLVQTIIENPMLNGEVIRLDGACRLRAQLT